MRVRNFYLTRSFSFVSVFQLRLGLCASQNTTPTFLIRRPKRIILSRSEFLCSPCNSSNFCSTHDICKVQVFKDVVTLGRMMHVEIWVCYAAFTSQRMYAYARARVHIDTHTNIRTCTPIHERTHARTSSYPWQRCS